MVPDNILKREKSQSILSLTISAYVQIKCFADTQASGSGSFFLNIAFFNFFLLGSTRYQIVYNVTCTLLIVNYHVVVAD